MYCFQTQMKKKDRTMSPQDAIHCLNNLSLSFLSVLKTSTLDCLDIFECIWQKELRDIKWPRMTDVDRWVQTHINCFYFPHPEPPCHCQESFLLHVNRGIHTFLESEKLDHQIVFQFVIQLHYMLWYHIGHINTGIRVLAKYQGTTRKCDIFVSELNPIPNAKFTEWATVYSLAWDYYLGGMAI